MGTHAFVKVGNRFYDAERLRGEADWKDLPATNFGAGCGHPLCRSCKKIAKPYNLDAFQSFWKRHRIEWERYRRRAEQILRKENHELATC